ncbi:GNAT family protein, partial [Nonomuraea dietziae]
VVLSPAQHHYPVAHGGSWSPPPPPARPLYADPFHANTASVRLLEKHGFQPSGTVRHGEDEHILLVLHDLAT